MVEELDKEREDVKDEAKSKKERKIKERMEGGVTKKKKEKNKWKKER